MDTNRTASPETDPKLSFSRTIVFGLSLLFLIFIWHRNYNVLGDIHDYSIVAAIGGYLEHGRLAYRDFTTPLQSLTIYLCYGSELVFGRRYLALAYGNLILGLAFYLSLFRLLPRELNFFLRVIAAMAVCVCTLFQHGVIWYNPVAMALLTLVSLYAARLFRRDRIGTGQLARLGGLLFLSSMGKMNFHFIGLGIVAAILGMWCWIHRPRPASIAVAAGVLVLCGLVLGPVTEIILNRTTPAVFVQNVLVTPAKRGGHLLSLVDPHLLFGKLMNAYPDDWSSGAFLFGFLIYSGCWGWAFCLGQRETASAETRGLGRIGIGISALLPVFFGASMILAATNDETQILTASFLVVGWISVFGMFRPYISAWQRSVLTLGVYFLGAFFLITGGASAFMHSRVRLFEESWSSLMMRTLHVQKSLSALKHALPLYDAHEIFQGQGSYLDGVLLTEASRKPLEKIASFMARTHSGKTADDVFWGPDCIMMSRMYNSIPKARLPLWYDRNVTLQSKDAPWIIEALKNAHYDWIVNTHEVGLPDEVIAWVHNNYECVEQDEISVYHALQPPAATPVGP